MMEYFQEALIILALSTNNILYFLRVRAVCGKSRNITIFFGCCACIVFGITLSAPLGVRTAVSIGFFLGLSKSPHINVCGQHIASTSRCIVTRIHPWLSSLMVCNAFNGTFVFLAISYRIASQNMRGQGWPSALRGFFRGDGTMGVVKQLFHHSQLCYL